MISLKKQQDGFTIVELIIVIVVIGILAAIAITSYSGVTKNSRNKSRDANLTQLKASIETYQADAGNYPRLQDINSDTFRSTNMRGFDKRGLYDPSAPSKTAANPVVATLTANQRAYAYNVTDESGASCEADATLCTKYTLTANYEGTVNGETQLKLSGAN